MNLWSWNKFEVISDWVHFAILSLLETSSDRVDADWIARRLGINKTYAQICFQRLLDLGLIAETEGRLKQTGKSIKFENTVSVPARALFIGGLLEKAMESLRK